MDECTLAHKEVKMVIEIGIIMSLVGAFITALFVIIGYLINKWMNGLDKKFDVLFGKVDKIEDKFNTSSQNTQKYREQLANDIKSMALQMTVANGRTGKLETNIELVESTIALEVGKVKGKIDTQMKLCEERNKNHYSEYQPIGLPQKG